MANNRELSQFASLITIDDSDRSIGINTSVGIGTTNPQATLHVVGDTLVTGVSTFNTDVYITDQLFVGGIEISGGGSAIGTDITTRNLNVTGISTLGIASASQLNITGVSTISVNSSSDALRITQTGSGNALVVEDSASPDSTPFVVTGIGSVGIGTTLVGTKLYVRDENQNSNTYSSQVYRTSTNFSSGVGHRAYYESYYTTAGVQTSYASGINAQVSASVAAGSTNNGYIRAGLDAAWRNNANAQSSTDNGTLAYLYGRGISYGHFNDNAVSPITNTATGLYLTPYCLTGSIGTLIGLDINSVSTAVGATATNVRGINCEIDATDGTNPYNLYISGNAKNYIAGSVGIGTTNPGAKLNVVDNSSSDALRITQTGAGNALVVEDESNPDATPFVVSAAGAVGIGTTNPTELLFIKTDQNSGTSVRVENNFAGNSSNASIRVSSGSTTIRLSAHNPSRTGSKYGVVQGGYGELSIDFGLGLLVGTQNATPLILGTNDTEALRIDSSQRVGIGTTNPLGTLQVGAAGTTVFVVTSTGSVGIGLTNPTRPLHISKDAPSSTTAQILAEPATGSNAVLIQLQNSSPSNFNLGLLNSSGAIAGFTGGPSLAGFIGLGGANPLIFATNNTEALRIDSSQRVGIGTTNPTSKLQVQGDARVSGVVTATTFIGALTGIAASATKLVTPRTFEITGDVVATAISFDGTGNVSLAATIQPNSVGLGTDTTGDYVRDITGTSNQITVTGGTGEGSTPTLSIPNQFTPPQDVTVTRDLQVNRNLNVSGNITIGGTSATLFSQELKIFDPDIVLGFRTDAFGNDISTDNTANHGGIAIASTEGTPLISLYDVGVGETNPATYKKFMWFKSGTFSGLGTDAWLSNYAIGIGSTQVPLGVRLAAGGMQVTDSTLSIPQLNVTGISTFSNGPVLIGSGTSTGTASQTLQVTGGAYIAGDTVNGVGLGIGVTNPIYPVDIRLNGLNTNTPQIRIYPTTGTRPASIVYVNGASSNFYTGLLNSVGSITTGITGLTPYAGIVGLSSGTTPLLLVTNALERVRIFDTGEVGIGTTVLTGTASQPLQVAGGAYFSGPTGVGATLPFNIGANHGTFTISGSDTSRLYFEDTGYEATGAGVGQFLYDNGNLSWFVGSRNGSTTTGSNELFKVLEGGNVGIGTTNPNQLLHLNSSSSNQVVINLQNSNTGGNAWLLQSSGGSSNIGQGHFSIFDSNANQYRLIINSSGNLGIGTTNPTAKLNVVDNSSSDALRITQLGSGNALVVEDSTNPDATPFVIDSIGRVGIGTTNPSQILHLQDSQPFIRFVETDAAVDNKNWIVGVNNQEFYWQALTDAGAGGGNIFKMTRSNQQIQTLEGLKSGVTWFIIDNNTQTVGIGTTNPGAKLNVVDNSSSDALRITQTGSGNALVVEDSTNPDATPFVVRADGKVGVGTTGLIQYSSGVNDTSTFGILAPTGNDSAFVLKGNNGSATDGSGQTLTLVVGSTGGTGSGSLITHLSHDTSGIGTRRNAIRFTDNQIRFEDNVSGSVDVTINSSGSGELLVGRTSTTGTSNQLLQVEGGAYVSGSVGIGTTNPQSALSFGPNSVISAATIDGSDNTRLSISGGGDATTTRGGFIDLSGNERSIDAGSVDINSGNVANSYVRIQGRSSTSDIRFWINASEAARFDNNGRLGIGTTNPIFKLDVIGAARVTGGNTAEGGEQNLIVRSSDSNNIPTTIATGDSNATLQVFAGGFTSGSRRGGQIDFVAGAATTNPGTLIFRTGIATGGTSQPERVRIDASGNLGIGTTNPGSLLQVQGNTLITGIATVNSNFVVNGNTLFADATNNRVGIGTTNPVTPLHISDGNGGISTALYTSDYAIISAQNTSPGFNIIVAGSTLTQRGVFKATRARGTLSAPTVPLVDDGTFSLLGAIYDGSTNLPTAAVNMEVDGAVGVGTAPQRISFWTGIGSSRLERARITSTGNIGIGTTNPTSLLQVNGNVLVSGVSTFVGDGSLANPAIFARRDSGNTAGIKLFGSSGGNYVYSESTGSNPKPLVIDTAQNKEIYIRIGGDTKVAINTTGELLVGVLTATGTANQTLQVHSGGAYIAGDTVNGVALGIGVTNPSNPVDIRLNASAANGSAIKINPSTGTNAAAILYNNNASSNFYTGLLNSNGAVGSITGKDAYAAVVGNSAGTTPLLFITNNVEALRIDSSQRVGIGTTNPQTALDVRGAVTLGIGTVGINSVFSTTQIQSWQYTNKSKAAGDTAPVAVYVGAAGTTLFVVGDTANAVIQYTLSTPYDVSTAGAAITTYSVATQDTNPTGIDFKPDGTKMFISGLTGVAPLIAAGEYVHEYSLSVAWDLSPTSIVGYTTSYNVTQDTSPQGVTFGNNGAKMYVVGNTNDTIYQYSLSTPYSLATGVTYDNVSLAVGTLVGETTPTDLSFNSTGTVLWLIGQTNDRIYEFRLGTAWDISTAVFYDDVYIGFNEISPGGLHVIPEQNVAYIVGSTSDIVFQYSTNTPAVEVASSGISTSASIVLNNETRVKDKLYVKGAAHFDSTLLMQGTLTVDGAATVASNLTVSGGTITAGNVAASLLTGNTTTAINFATALTTGSLTIASVQTTGTLILGGTSQTGTMTLGQSTVSQTTNIQAGASGVGTTKTINLGTGGLSGSVTNINIGPTAGVGTVVINSGTNVGIGTTNPQAKLHVVGDVLFNNTTAQGSVTSTGSTTVAIGIHSGLSTSTYRSVEYTIQATQGTDYHSTKILALHDGTTAYHSEYGTIYNNISVATYDVDVSGGNIRLLATGASASSTNYVVNFVATKI